LFFLAVGTWGGTDAETQFSYIEGSGTGPEDWGRFDPRCGNGTMQSPIDIRQVQVSPTLGELQRHYKPAPARLVNSGHDIAVSCCFCLYFDIFFRSCIFI
jgi:carbonic anhydrase